jgi:hypothetical protein
MIPLLTNPPAPLALRVDLLEFSKPRPPPTLPELIWKLHKIIANPASRAEQAKMAKRSLLDAIAHLKQSQLPGAARRRSLRQKVDAKDPLRLGHDNTVASGVLAKIQDYHETNQN